MHGQHRSWHVTESRQTEGDQDDAANRYMTNAHRRDNQGRGGARAARSATIARYRWRNRSAHIRSLNLRHTVAGKGSGNGSSTPQMPVQANYRCLRTHLCRTCRRRCFMLSRISAMAGLDTPTILDVLARRSPHRRDIKREKDLQRSARAANLSRGNLPMMDSGCNKIASFIWRQDHATLGTTIWMTKALISKNCMQDYTGSEMGRTVGTLNDDLEFGHTVWIHKCTVGNLEAPPETVERDEASNGNLLHTSKLFIVI